VVLGIWKRNSNPPTMRATGVRIVYLYFSIYTRRRMSRDTRVQLHIPRDIRFRSETYLLCTNFSREIILKLDRSRTYISIIRLFTQYTARRIPIFLE